MLWCYFPTAKSMSVSSLFATDWISIFFATFSILSINFFLTDLLFNKIRFISHVVDIGYNYRMRADKSTYVLSLGFGIYTMSCIFTTTSWNHPAGLYYPTFRYTALPFTVSGISSNEQLRADMNSYNVLLHIIRNPDFPMDSTNEFMSYVMDISFNIYCS